jgi:hypothetical protein
MPSRQAAQIDQLLLVSGSRKLSSRVQRSGGVLNFFVDFRFVDSAFQNHRDIGRHKLTHLLKGEDWLEAGIPAFGIISLT